MDAKSSQFHTYVRGVILIGYALLILKLILTLQLENFVAAKMHKYLYFALSVFTVLGILQIIRGTSTKGDLHDHCGCHGHELPKSNLKSLIIYSLFIAPIIIGFLLPNHILDSSVVSKRGVKIGGQLFTAPPSFEDLDVDTQSRTPNKEDSPKQDESQSTMFEEDYEKFAQQLLAQEVLVVQDEFFIQTLSILDENLDSFIGKQIKMTGFIYREEGFRKDQAVIARFSVSCCVADAAVYGVLAEGEMLEELEVDTWIDVIGTIGKINFNGQDIPIITKPEFEVREIPKKPYVEEFYIQIK
ncbi:TIGR03943 family protein [Bacillus timonensis]|nr:TIGR03943 family protein [Bacillus timonensis]